MLPEVPFFFLRHGETIWNEQWVAMGQLDIPVSDKGLAQADEAARILKPHHIQQIVCSPLERAQATARRVAAQLQIEWRVDDRLKQAYWGHLEGKPRGDDTWHKNWFAGITPEGVESYQAFRNRTLLAIEQALLLRGPVLIVAHGSTFGIIQSATGQPFIEVKHGLPVHLNINPQKHCWEESRLAA